MPLLKFFNIKESFQIKFITTLIFDICTLYGQKMKKKTIFEKKLPFLSRYSHEIALLAIFFVKRPPFIF